MSDPRYFLSVTAIFRNEVHILKEWLDHYLAEGVDHFYLIDNDSTDNWEKILVPYVERGQITLFRDKRRHHQERAYNEHVFPIKDQTEWMIVCDLDEFIYGKKDSIAGFIRGLPHIVNGIRLPWIVFGSSGHVAQPRSVVDGFRKRKRYYPKGCLEVAKNIVRTRDVTRFGIHVHTISGWVVFDGCCRSVKNETSGEQDEDYIRDAALLLNHYRIQSRDWYRQTKMTRGVALDPDIAFHAAGYKVDEKYFLDNDFDDVIDDTLAVKRGFRPSPSPADSQEERKRQLPMGEPHGLVGK